LETAHLYLGFDNRRHEFDSFHQEYNRATGELLKRFMGEQNISEPEQMTPDHARAVGSRDRGLSRKRRPQGDRAAHARTEGAKAEVKLYELVQ
jgi:hypothetical protein